MACPHYCNVIMSTMASQITSLTIVYSTVYSGSDRRKHQSSAPLAFVRGIHRRPVNSPYKGPVMPKMFPFDDVIMINVFAHCSWWRDSIETISKLLGILRGKSTGNLWIPLMKCKWYQALMFSSLSAWIICWTNNTGAAYLRPYDAHETSF